MWIVGQTAWEPTCHWKSSDTLRVQNIKGCRRQGIAKLASIFNYQICDVVCFFVHRSWRNLDAAIELLSCTSTRKIRYWAGYSSVFLFPAFFSTPYTYFGCRKWRIYPSSLLCLEGGHDIQARHKICVQGYQIRVWNKGQEELSMQQEETCILSGCI